MEQFDVLDRNGQRMGMVAGKGEPLHEGQYYLGVHAYIHNTAGEFLLQRRALDKSFMPGGWEIHMGHVMAGETGAQAMVREIGEEIGLRIDEDALRKAARMIWDEEHHMIDVYFIQREFALEDLVLQPEEVIGAKWVGAVEMMAFVEGMDYRPEAYRRAVIGELVRLGAK